MSDGQQNLHLFIPGPASVSSDVMEALGHPITPHYGDAFVAAYNRCVECMQEVFRTTNVLRPHDPATVPPGEGRHEEAAAYGFGRYVSSPARCGSASRKKPPGR